MEVTTIIILERTKEIMNISKMLVEKKDLSKIEKVEHPEEVEVEEIVAIEVIEVLKLLRPQLNKNQKKSQPKNDVWILYDY